VQGELKRPHWGEKERAGRRKGDKAKMEVAERLRRETTMTLAWIASRLRMGTAARVAHLIYWKDRKGAN